MTQTHFPIELLKCTALTDKLHLFTFSTPEALNFDFIPGQFVNIFLPYQGESLQRSYSIASIPNPERTIEIAVAYVEGGRASEVLFNLQPGDKIDASGPFGRLIFKETDENKRYLLIATGTGVAPYRAMLGQVRQMLQDNPSREVVVVLGVRTVEELLYYDEFVALANEVPNFKFYACTSRESRDNPGPCDYAGRVSAVFEQLQFNSEQDIVYLCGNPDMVDETYRYCTEQGFTFRNVRREKYVFSK